MFKFLLLPVLNLRGDTDGEIEVASKSTSYASFAIKLVVVAIVLAIGVSLFLFFKPKMSSSIDKLKSSTQQIESIG